MLETLIAIQIHWLIAGQSINEYCNVDRPINGCYWNTSEVIYIAHEAPRKRRTLAHEIGHHLYKDYPDELFSYNGLFTSKENMVTFFATWIMSFNTPLQKHIELVGYEQVDYFKTKCDLRCQIWLKYQNIPE